MIVLDGKKYAQEIINEVKSEILDFQSKNSIELRLMIVLVGDDPASSVYVNNKTAMAINAGFKAEVLHLTSDILQDELLDIIDSLNDNKKIHGILVQLPLPEKINKDKILSRISKHKDVDGLNFVNVGGFMIGDKDSFIPATPQACLYLAQKAMSLLGDDLAGKNVVIVGRSLLVGRPCFELFLRSDCTVTMVHSKSKDIINICNKADILVVASGKKKMVNYDWIKDNAVIIDVGIHRDDNNKLCGDVNFDSIKEKVAAITPVPGGVGPLTVAFMIKNCLQSGILSLKA